MDPRRRPTEPDGIATRSVGVAFRSPTGDTPDGVVPAVISTETRARAIDWDRMEVVDEVLVSRGLEPVERVPMLDAHERGSVEAVLGTVRDIAPGDGEVRAAFHFDVEDPRAFAALGKQQRGHLTDVSVGFVRLAKTRVAPGGTSEVDGREWTADPARAMWVTSRWRLSEVSLVPIGADPEAKFRELCAARAAMGDDMSAETNPEETANAAPNDGKVIDLDAARATAATAATAAERQRVRDIRELAREDVPADLVGRAIDGGWSPDRFAREALAVVRRSGETPAASDVSPPPAGATYGFARRSYERPPLQQLRELGFGLRHQIGAPLRPIADVVRDAATSHRTQTDHRGRPLAPRVFGISDAARGMPGAERLSPQDYDRAAEEGYAYRTLAATDFLREAYEIATGRRAPRGNGIFDLLWFDRSGLHVKDGIRAAGVSTADLANVFTDSITAQLIRSYELADDTTVFVREAEVNDFRSQERPRAGSLDPMGKLPRSGAVPAKFNTLSDTVETYKVARYADQFAFDERDFIDDRLDLFATIPQAMGMNAAQLRPDLVYYILLNGATAGLAAGAIFSSGNANYTASSGALSAATLKAALSKMATQTESSADGSVRNLNIEARYLVTPRATRWTALELINSTLIVLGGDTGIGERGSANVLAGALEIVSDSRFDNGVKDPASGSSAAADADGWALIAAQQYPTIEVGYTRATGRAPVIRPYTLDRGQWGMGADIKLDIGAKALDFRAMYYSAGA